MKMCLKHSDHIKFTEFTYGKSKNARSCRKKDTSYLVADVEQPSSTPTDCKNMTFSRTLVVQDNVSGNLKSDNVKMVRN